MHWLCDRFERKKVKLKEEKGEGEEGSKKGDVLIICCFIPNHSETQRLKRTTIIYFVYESEIWPGLSGDSLSLSHVVPVGVAWPELSIYFQDGSLIAGKLALVIGSFPCWLLPWDGLIFLTAWWLDYKSDHLKGQEPTADNFLRPGLRNKYNITSVIFN